MPAGHAMCSGTQSPEDWSGAANDIDAWWRWKQWIWWDLRGWVGVKRHRPNMGPQWVRPQDWMSLWMALCCLWLGHGTGRGVRSHPVDLRHGHRIWGCPIDLWQGYGIGGHHTDFWKGHGGTGMNWRSLLWPLARAWHRRSPRWPLTQERPARARHWRSPHWPPARALFWMSLCWPPERAWLRRLPIGHWLSSTSWPRPSWACPPFLANWQSLWSSPPPRKFAWRSHALNRFRSRPSTKSLGIKIMTNTRQSPKQKAGFKVSEQSGNNRKPVCWVALWPRLQTVRCSLGHEVQKSGLELLNLTYLFVGLLYSKNHYRSARYYDTFSWGSFESTAKNIGNVHSPLAWMLAVYLIIFWLALFLVRSVVSTILHFLKFSLEKCRNSRHPNFLIIDFLVQTRPSTRSPGSISFVC